MTGITSPIVRAALLASLAVGLALTVTLAEPYAFVFFLAFAGIGTFLAVRRPLNIVGWLLLVMGWGLGLGSIRSAFPMSDLVVGELGPADAIVAWSSACGWAFALSAFLGISLVFPGGYLPAGHGRRPARLAVIVMASLLVLIVGNPVINLTPSDTGIAIDAPNPFAIAALRDLHLPLPGPGELYPAMFVLVIAGVVSLLVRYWRSSGLERFQFRWLVVAISVAVLANGIWAIVYQGLAIDTPIVWLGVAVAYPCIPIAIAFAIQRYHLYEIDRIISRTIAYGVVITVVAGVFGGGILVLSTVLGSVAAGSSIAVAGATIVAYMVAQPALRGIRRVVDRRFDRTRYDTDRIASSFTSRLRHETDIDTVVMDLVTTARSTVAPATSSVWLRAPGTTGTR